MSWRYSCLVILLCVFVAMSFGRSVRSEETESASGPVSLTVGIGGAWKNGFQTPVTIETSDPEKGGTLEVMTFDPDGTPTVTRKPRTRASETIYVPIGRADGPLTVRLVSESGPVWEKSWTPTLIRKRAEASSDRPAFLFTQPLSAERPTYMLVGDEGIGLAEAFGELRVKESRRPQLVKVDRFEDFPDCWYGWESVECVILTTTEPDFFAGVAVDDPRWLALEQWLRAGGRLVLAAGGDATELLAPGGVLARFVPGTIDPARKPEIRIANNLTQYVPKAKNLVMTGSLDSPFLTPPYLGTPSPDAQVEVAEMETPLLVRSPFGLGSVTFFAADPARAPIANWSGRSGLLLRVFQFDTDSSRKSNADRSLVQLGYSDLAGQLRSTLDRFDGIRNVPFSLILVLVFVYILLIGPGDWYLTHKILKRPNLTWVTFPCWILLFCIVAIALSRSARPDGLRVNTAELIDLDQSSGLVRGTLWAGLYSPTDAQYDIQLRPEATDPAMTGEPESRFSWFGLTGTGLGGMAPKTISPVSWPSAWELGTVPDQLSGMPMRVRSTRSLTGQWLWQLKTKSPGTLTSFDSVPVGTVVNPFSVPLRNAILYYNRWAVDLGDLAPGETTLDVKTPRIERHLALGGPEYPFADASRNATRRGNSSYDTESTSIPYILRMMMFYRLTGGSDQLGLDHVLAHDTDLSDLLRTGRAVLTGTICDESPGKTSVSDAAVSDAALPLSGVVRVSRPSDGAGAGQALPVASRHTLVIRMILPVGKNHD